MPDFQREEVWSDSKKRLLIDSILRGWHLPKFYFRKLDNGVFECIDGQQRLTAIWEFFEDSLVLDPSTSKKYGGTRYSDLPDTVSDAFDDFEIDLEEIEDAQDEDLEELFKRLQLGTPLNTAEKINAISGDLRDFCHAMTHKPFFLNKIGLKNTRYTHFETVVKWAFIEARGVSPHMRYQQLESFLRENKSFSSASKTAKTICGALDFLDQAFPDKCPLLRNRANTLSFLMLAGRLQSLKFIKEKHALGFRAFTENFFPHLAAEVERGVKATDKELIRYQSAISSGSTGGNSIRTRIDILTKRLATEQLVFSNLVGSNQGAAEEAEMNINELVSRAKNSLYAINKNHQATHGTDLFKPTNESMPSLDILSQPCRDIDQYKRIIDALYFLIYEGSGSCARLPSPAPPFAMDIKFLRTAIRHDVDHGKEVDIAKKRLRAADIFDEISGKKTPEECGPAEFLVVHVRILDELNKFLNGLLK